MGCNRAGAIGVDRHSRPHINRACRNRRDTGSFLVADSDGHCCPLQVVFRISLGAGRRIGIIDGESVVPRLQIIRHIRQQSSRESIAGRVVVEAAGECTERITIVIRTCNANPRRCLIP